MRVENQDIFVTLAQRVYSMDHKFDLLRNIDGRAFALRLYFDMMVQELIGTHEREAERFFARLIQSRYAHLTPLYHNIQVGKPRPNLCTGAYAHEIPTAQHVVCRMKTLK